MLNSRLDLGAYRKEFSKTGRVRITDALPAETAAALSAEMEQVPFKMFCATGAGVAVIDPAELVRWDRQRQNELLQKLNEAASRAEGFVYFGHRLNEAFKDGAPDSALGRFYNGMRSKQTLEAIQKVTDARTFDNVFAQATEYRPGHYLTRHLDDPEGEHRKFAFVLGLTKKWDPDWGGLLQFFDDKGQPTDALSPGYNTLDLFDVRHVHSVTFTTPFCLNPRHAISGWFVKGDPLRPQDYTHPGRK